MIAINEQMANNSVEQGGSRLRVGNRPARFLTGRPGGGHAVLRLRTSMVSLLVVLLIATAATAEPPTGTAPGASAPTESSVPTSADGDEPSTAAAATSSGTNRAPAPVTPGLKPENVVILVNKNVPESVELGRYYAGKRGIDESQICYLETVDTEQISPEDFSRTIELPVRDFLRNRLGRMQVSLPTGELDVLTSKHDIRALVLMYGLPLKTTGFIDTKDMYKSMAASVDSELALLPQGSHIRNGALGNPYFNADTAFSPLLARRMLLVTRLDGPEPAIVRRMIDDALWAEANGLCGRAYFDVRNINSGGYAKGDRWIRGAYAATKAAGMSSHIDELPEVLPIGFNMPEAAVYLGWYKTNVSGAIARPGFTFARGAVAYHLHSFAGWTLRSTDKNWVGPLVSRGATATMGAVYEPFLDGTPHLDIFMNRLLRGYTFAEASYMSQPLLSWMMVFVGDPLYRPFAAKVQPPTGPEPVMPQAPQQGQP